MDSAGSAFKNFFVTLSSPEVLAEILAIVIAGLIAVAGAQAARNWHKKHGSPGDMSKWSSRGMEGRCCSRRSSSR